MKISYNLKIYYYKVEFFSSLVLPRHQIRYGKLDTCHPQIISSLRFFLAFNDSLDMGLGVMIQASVEARLTKFSKKKKRNSSVERRRHTIQTRFGFIRQDEIMF